MFFLSEIFGVILNTIYNVTSFSASVCYKKKFSLKAVLELTSNCTKPKFALKELTLYLYSLYASLDLGTKYFVKLRLQDLKFQAYHVSKRKL